MVTVGDGEKKKTVGEGDAEKNGVSEERAGLRGKFFRLCLTGGPCGGKTTLQGFVGETFEKMGWDVFRSPEVATILIGGGVRYAELNEEQKRRFQVDVLEVMMRIEGIYNGMGKKAAEDGRNVIVIYDRGVVDGSVYLGKDEWKAVCKEAGVCEVELRDKRYDCVIHLVSAADGAVEHYGNSNNPARLEGAEAAWSLDRQTINAWAGHPCLEIIDNSTDFEGKKERVLQTIFKHIGVGDTGQKDVKKPMASGDVLYYDRMASL